MRILVVEDNFVARKIICNFLQPYGLIDIAADGEEALEAVQLSLNDGQHYNLILLDILMPRMDGNVVLQEIRNVEKVMAIDFAKRSKIIMTSSVQDNSIILDSFNQQCDGFLRKPITKEKLLTELTNLKITTIN